METLEKKTVRRQKFETINGKAINIKEPKRLSKFGMWREKNPEGVFIVLDRRAVNK